MFPGGTIKSFVWRKVLALAAQLTRRNRGVNGRLLRLQQAQRLPPVEEAVQLRPVVVADSA